LCTALITVIIIITVLLLASILYIEKGMSCTGSHVLPLSLYIV